MKYFLTFWNKMEHLTMNIKKNKSFTNIDKKQKIGYNKICVKSQNKVVIKWSRRQFWQ